VNDDDLVALERVRAICLRFVGADEGELQNRPLFRVGRRRFAIFNGAGSPPRPRWNDSIGLSAGRACVTPGRTPANLSVVQLLESTKLTTLMSRGLGTIQRAVLDVVDANPDGLAADAIAGHLYGRAPTRAQLESVRRAIRTLHGRGLVSRTTRFDRRPRKSLKRFIDLAPCEAGFCGMCAQRKRRVRLNDWHRKAMRDNGKHDPAWLNDLAAAKQSGFVHATASSERIIDEKPNTVDQCHRRLQFISPPQPDR
jgi:hypothetical protein